MTRLPTILLGLTTFLGSSCKSGETTLVWDYVASAPPPQLVVYYPAHETWDTWLMRTRIHLDGEPIGRLGQGDFLTLPVVPGRYVLTASTDDDWGCRKTPGHPWPPLELEVGEETVFVRFGVDPYEGPETRGAICVRRLVEVGEGTARGEVDRLDLVDG